MSSQVDFVLNWLEERNPLSVVYVGWRKDSDCAPILWCQKRGICVTVIEAHKPNVVAAVSRGFCAIHGRIDDMVLRRSVGAYGACLWLHGPEHVSRDVMWYTLGGLADRCAYVLVQAPVGEDPQDAINGNPYEIHVQALTEKDFDRMGWATDSHMGECTFSAWTGG